MLRNTTRIPPRMFRRDGWIDTVGARVVARLAKSREVSGIGQGEKATARPLGRAANLECDRARSFVLGPSPQGAPAAARAHSRPVVIQPGGEPSAGLAAGRRY